MTSYQRTLLIILDTNNWSELPNYPEDWASLDDQEFSVEVELYCLKIIKNLPELIKINS